MSSEFDFIERLRRRTERRRQRAASFGLTRGIGDDAAVIKQFAKRETIVSADLLVEDIDFRREWTTPRLLGHKALAVSLSDIAAMGARPRFCLLALGVPLDVWRSNFVNEFYAGLFALADAHNVSLIGGDVSRTPERIVIDSIVIGEAKSGRAVARAGAQPGDQIFVTGWLGGAALGLRLLEAGARLPHRRLKRTKVNARDRLLLRQLRPEPRLVWGAQLGEHRVATAMIDISDGLSSDLAHLCRASNVGATIEAISLPVDPLIKQAGKRRKHPGELRINEALESALDGGEDYELLFTVTARRAARLPQALDGVPVTRIGEITKRRARGVQLIEMTGARRQLDARGFAHFHHRAAT